MSYARMGSTTASSIRWCLPWRGHIASRVPWRGRFLRRIRLRN